MLECTYCTKQIFICYPANLMIKITSLIGYRKGENVNACIMQLLHSSCQYNRVGVCTREALHMMTGVLGLLISIHRLGASLVSFPDPHTRGSGHETSLITEVNPPKHIVWVLSWQQSHMKQLVLYVKYKAMLSFFQIGVTPLYIACWKGHRDIVECLLRANADVNCQREVRNNLICSWRLLIQELIQCCTC